MKYILIFLLSFSQPVFATAKDAKPTKKARLKGPLEPFDHPEILDSCLPKKMCEEIAKDFCLKPKAKFLRCSEQYKDSWIVTCQCL